MKGAMKTVYKFPPYLSEECGRMFNVLCIHGFHPVSPGPPGEIAIPAHELPALKMLVKAKPAFFSNHLKEAL